ncbi:ABC transporter ATP-binding protein [Desulfurivibrio alkaliphilus]|uniref:ABC transporter related protein n=1 Tax=Desulfurivibrio alkaliphilus (strain DSM 19089 / UNIQEM U267 / AHT2) TaxID=589865 RepID=D6Z5T3_DESAT|nr:ABC transporter ATP-binding protein [Desulfurivibrio alkaliphilus]ADH84815.1 ABC transporter related protein [Desulfurivibrio alkaliphilus AHT 2]
MALLEIDNLCKRFGGLHAVSEVSFAVEPGIIKAVIGPNGAGKTTLFNLIAGSLPVTSGQVSFEGKTITGSKPYQIAEQGISRTYQNIKLYHGMTALENVMIGRHVRSSAGFIAGMLNLPGTRKEEREIRDYCMSLLEMLEVGHLADTEATSLSFGQQRTVEMARALALEPKLLLLDEPAAGLNIYETAEVGRLISKINQQGITVLLVEHDMSLVMEISHEIVVLSFGRKIAEDEPAAIQQDQEVIKIYLGEADDDA